MSGEEQQTAVSKWSEELLGSFTTVVSKTEAGLQIVKDIAEFYRARAKLEDEYAKKLAVLCKTPPGAGFFTKEPAVTKEHRTLKESLLGILEKGTKVSDAHQEFANKINTEICKNLDTWIKNKTNDRLKTTGEGQKHVKIVADAKASVVRNKGEYERLMKETDVIKEQLIKAEKDQQNSPDNKKLPPITKRAAERWSQGKDKAKALESSYQMAVKKGNEELEVYRSEKMPSVLENLQKWEEERWNVLLSSVRTFKTIQEAVPVVIDTQTKELVNNYEAADIEADFREFINSNKKEEIPLTEDNLEFVQFKSKFPDDEEEKKEETPVEKKEEPKKVEEKKEPKKVEEKKEPKKVEEKKEEPKKVEEKKEEPKEDDGKKEAERKKNEELKANLFGDSSDMFK